MKSADLILHNGRVLTMDAAETAGAVAIDGERIICVGEDDEVLRLATGETEVVNLRGLAVLPGFIDTHVHFVSTGMRLHHMVDLTGLHSLPDLLQLIGGEAGEKEPGEWILGWGFDHFALEERRYPTIEELDRAAPHNPVFLRRRDGHSSILNSAGLDTLNLSPETGGFNVDARGRPTGVLQATANSTANGKMQKMMEAPEMGRQACAAAAREAASVGITTLHALTGGNPDGPEGRAMELAEKSLPVRLVKYFQTTDVAAVLEAGLPRIGGCILIDGSIGSQTAALMEPYSDDPGTRGVLYFEQGELDEFIRTAHTAGLQVAVHAIGDRAIEQALSAYEAVLNDPAVPPRDHRHRIEHFLIPTADQMRRARALGITPAMQPAFEHFWGGAQGLYAQRLGDRVARTNPLRALFDLGINVGGGSDSLVTPMNPLLGIHSAVNHPNPEHRLSPEEAVRLFTVNAAYQAFEEADKGSICRGRLADLVLLSADPTSAPPVQIRDIEVVATINGGRFVYGGDSVSG
ncbi:MAG: amidohydrolase [Bacillota bacterium]